MRFTTGLWLSLVVVTLHNVEEYATIPRFYAEHGAEIPALAARLARPFVGSTFVVAILLITVLALLLIDAGTRGGPGSLGTFLGMTWVMGGLLANGLHHVLLSAYFAAYTPGLLTSVTLLVPLGAWLVRRALLERRLQPDRMAWSAVAGIVAMGPVIFLARAVAELVLA